MTVEELIERLKQEDPKLPVTVVNEVDNAFLLDPDDVRVVDGPWYGQPGDDGETHRLHPSRRGPHVRIG